MSREILIFVLVLATCAVLFEFGGRKPPEEAPPKPVPRKTTSKPVIEHVQVECDVQMALILDTSASMDGLILQAQEQLIAMVEDLKVSDDGKEQTIALALYRYGTNKASKNDGYTECLVPLTLDHSRVVDALSWLKAGGQEEYAPFAISKATSELAWNPNPKVPKVIVIIGNETFSAGPVGTDDAIQAAESAKVKILPIYCVGAQASKSAVSGWRRAAHLAGTEFNMIDPNQVVAKLDKPIEKPPVIRVTPQPIPEPPPRIDGGRRRVGHKPVLSSYQSKAKARRPQSYSKETMDFRSGVRKGVKGVLRSY